MLFRIQNMHMVNTNLIMVVVRKYRGMAAPLLKKVASQKRPCLILHTAFAAPRSPRKEGFQLLLSSRLLLEKSPSLTLT